IGSLLLGTPILSLIGAVGASLSLGSRKSGILMPLLVLPLFIPVLIFGVSAVEAVIMNLPSTPQLYLLGGMLLGSFALTPWASATALKHSVE
ncbi:MAG: heme exporter protein CcmB, partial [Pseudomonadota bacterium]|nr:heme exporter protein CcmB [Pseudomonadota bacterium]